MQTTIHTLKFIKTDAEGVTHVVREFKFTSGNEARKAAKTLTKTLGAFGEVETDEDTFDLTRKADEAVNEVMAAMLAPAEIA
jgi:hypothetical protein